MLYADDASLSWAADDFGHFVRARPAGVLRPKSAADIQAALAAGQPLRPRGQGHSTAGQAQAHQGVVVDMRGLNRVSIDGQSAVAEAGARWSEVLAASLPLGLTPPVLTDYLELSVGGTLSVGGIGGMTHQYGFQVDNVTKLEVLTPGGAIETCRAGDGLFDRVRGGFGEHGIILRATIPLLPAKPNVRRYRLRYNTLADFLADQRTLLAARRFDYLEGQIIPGWTFEIDAAKYHDKPPSDADLLAGLSYTHIEAIEELSYFDFVNRLAEGVDLLRSLGHWDLPHPWLNLFLPDDAVAQFVADLTAETTLDDIGETGLILVYPFDTTMITARRPRLPSTPVAFLVAPLRTARDQATLHRMLAMNEALRQRTLAVGGTVYLAGRGGTP